MSGLVGSVALDLLVALLPLYVHDLGELEIGRVRGEEAIGRRVGGSHADLGVDVEHAFRTAGRPDNRGAVSFIMLKVVAIQWTNEVVFRGRLHGH